MNSDIVVSPWGRDSSFEYTDNRVLFTQRALLSEYSKRIQSWANAAESVALMNRSLFLRDVFAFAATTEQYDAGELLEQIAKNQTSGIEFRYEWLYRLGRVVALQNLSVSDTEFALFCLSESTFKLPFKSQRIDSLRLQVELFSEAGLFKKASGAYAELAALAGEQHHYLSVDLENPYVNPDSHSTEDWLRGFNEPLFSANLNGVSLIDGEGSPFDRLVAEPSPGPLPAGPLISVIMTSYAPDETAFELAARSILNQSWSNLELIVVDDATPGGAPEVLESMAETDSRVKIIKLSENRGTYYARNIGLRSASGTYVTGQDSDDWSHPDRLSRQIRVLERDKNISGVVATAIRTDDNLFRILRAVEPQRLCEVSLMFRKSIALEMGGYLESRKGADSEFRLRLELFSQRSVVQIQDPLYMTRLSRGSLSRGDFRRGWAHQNRRAFSNFMNHWHRTATTNALRKPDLPAQSAAIPPQFRSLIPDERNFDFVFLADWRFDGATLRSTLSEIEALRQSGKSVGIMQVAGIFPNKAPISKLLPAVQDRINTGELELVIPDENAKISVLIIRSAELLQFLPSNGFENQIDQLIVVANQAPSAWDGMSPLYHPEYCSERAEQLFGQRPYWLTQDPAVNRYLNTNAGGIEAWPEAIPHVLPHKISRHRTRIKGSKYLGPVIGRTAKNLEALWPIDLKTAKALWPDKDKLKTEVRIWGDARCYLRKYDKDVYPTHWVSFHAGDISLEAFYTSIDYFVYFPDEKWPQEFSYEALIAQAAGATVILPEHFASLHYRHATLTKAEDVPDLIRLKHLGQAPMHNGTPNSEHKALQDISRSEAAFVASLEMVRKTIEEQETKID